MLYNYSSVKSFGKFAPLKAIKLTIAGVAEEGGTGLLLSHRGALIPRRGKRLMPLGEFLRITVLLHGKIPSILLCSPPVGDPSPHVRQFQAQPLNHCLKILNSKIPFKFG